MSGRAVAVASILAGLVGAAIGLALAAAYAGTCVQAAVCESDGAGGCLPGPCDMQLSLLLWLLPLIGAVLAAGGAAVIATGRSRRREQGHPVSL